MSKVNHDICQTYVATSIRFLISNYKVRQGAANGNSLKSFIELANCAVSYYEEAASVSFASMSCNVSSRNCLVEPSLIDSCYLIMKNSSNLTSQRDAMFALSNICELHDSHKFIVSSGLISLLIDVVETCGDQCILREIARAFASLSFNEDMKVLLYENSCIPLLYELARSQDRHTQRFSLVAICNLCQSSKKENILGTQILDCLHFLVRFQDVTTERCSALSYASLALGNFNNCKERISGDRIAVKALFDMFDFPDDDVQLCSLLALNAITLGENKAPKACVMRDNNLSQVVKILSRSNADKAHCVIYLLGSLSEHDEVKDALVELGVIQHVIKHSELGSIEIKRASCYYLALLAENQSYHKRLFIDGAFPTIIAISSLSDVECQDYGAFALAYLASNRNYQMTLVKLGAVRPLVSMMASETESKHYAGLALLKLADNFETHLIIAEEGGIQALLSMGRNHSTDEELCYKTALTVGSLASNAVSSLPK